MTFPTQVTSQLMNDIKKQAPKAVCEVGPTNVSTNLIVNRDKPPFDNPELRKAMALALDRKAFIDIILRRPGRHRRRDAAAAGRRVGHAEGDAGDAARLRSDVKKNRAEAASDHGEARLRARQAAQVKVSTRNIATYRDPAVILIDQLKSIYIDGELEAVETGSWYAKVARKDYSVGLNLTGNGVDDPDQAFYENYACGSQRNYTGYCNKDLREDVRLSSRRKPTSRSARSWCGRSTRSCRRTWPGRSSFTRAKAPAGSPTSRA